MIISRLSLLVFVVLVFTACAGTYKHQPSAELKQKIDTIRIVAITPQEEIDKQFMPSTVGATAGVQGGAIGALIGSAIDASVNAQRAKEAEESVAAYREMLVDYDFHARLSAVAAERKDQLSWAKGETLVVDQVPADFKLRSYLRSIDEDALLVLYFQYSFSHDYDVLHVSAISALYDRGRFYSQKNLREKKRSAFDRTKDGGSVPKAEYKRVLQFQSDNQLKPRRQLTESELAQEIVLLDQQLEQELNSKNKQRQERARAKRKHEIKKLEKKQVSTDSGGDDWTKESIVANLEKGIDHVTHMILLDLNDARTETEYKAMERNFTTVFGSGAGNGSRRKGYLLGKYDGHDIIRLSNGGMFSIPEGDNIELAMPVR